MARLAQVHPTIAAADRNFNRIGEEKEGKEKKEINQISRRRRERGVRTPTPDDVAFFIPHVDCDAASRPIPELKPHSAAHYLPDVEPVSLPRRFH